MIRASMFALVGGLLVLAGPLSGQEAKPDPRAKEEPAKLKGFLPQYWGQIGLSDDQKQQVYRVQARYGADIEKLEAKIRELKETRDQEMLGVLTADQKKALINKKTGNVK